MEREPLQKASAGALQCNSFEGQQRPPAPHGNNENLLARGPILRSTQRPSQVQAKNYLSWPDLNKARETAGVQGQAGKHKRHLWRWSQTHPPNLHTHLSQHITRCRVLPQISNCYCPGRCSEPSGFPNLVPSTLNGNRS